MRFRLRHESISADYRPYRISVDERSVGRESPPRDFILSNSRTAMLPNRHQANRFAAISRDPCAMRGLLGMTEEHSVRAMPQCSRRLIPLRGEGQDVDR